MNSMHVGFCMLDQSLLDQHGKSLFCVTLYISVFQTKSLLLDLTAVLQIFFSSKRRYDVLCSVGHCLNVQHMNMSIFVMLTASVLQ